MSMAPGQKVGKTSSPRGGRRWRRSIIACLTRCNKSTNCACRRRDRRCHRGSAISCRINLRRVGTATTRALHLKMVGGAHPTRHAPLEWEDHHVMSRPDPALVLTTLRQAADVAGRIGLERYASKLLRFHKRFQTETPSYKSLRED